MQEEGQPPATGGEQQGSDGLNGVRVAVAAVVLVGFIAFVVFLMANADTAKRSEWERWVYLFAAVEAIAFAAVGWLFGREVNRERAEKAEQNADKAEQKAGTAEERAGAADRRATAEAMKGSKLAGMVIGGAAGAAGAAGGPEVLERGGLAGSDVGAGGLAEAVEFARRNYPDAT